MLVRLLTPSRRKTRTERGGSRRPHLMHLHRRRTRGRDRPGSQLWAVRQHHLARQRMTLVMPPKRLALRTPPFCLLRLTVVMQKLPRALRRVRMRQLYRAL